MYANQEDTHAMNAAASAEAQRQAGYQKQANQVFQTSLAQSSPGTAQQQMQQGQDKAQAQYQKLESIPLSTSAAPFQTGQNGQSMVQGQTQLSNNAQAKLQGYSEWDLQQAIKNLTANQQLGIINTNASRSAGVLPYEIQQAGHTGDMLSGIGGLFGAGGSVLGTYGALSSLGAAASTAPSVGVSQVPFRTQFANQLNPYGISPYASLGGL